MYDPSCVAATQFYYPRDARPQHLESTKGYAHNPYGYGHVPTAGRLPVTFAFVGQCDRSAATPGVPTTS